ncbi:MAG TPA: YdcF family protein [Cyclobacteriaceae bacterium]|jgi:uncharacterized SAM-binding protein YcdF (DUF218 family)|nr:YdcF family protein [Cyclobacteriaceae bacterium]
MKRIAKRILEIILYVHVILFFALVLTHCSFTHFAKISYAAAKKNKPFDVIIVPGIPYVEGETNEVMKMRVFWAKHLYDSGYAKNIIFSGSSVYSPYVEGIVMKIMADSLGIPPDHSFSETKAEHSTENVYYSWKMARDMGFKKIALATDPYQAGLLRGFVKEYCPGVKSIPIIFGTMNMGNIKLPVVNAQSAFVKDFVSITERQTLWERFRGTRGRRVREEVRAELKKKKKQKQEEASTN